MNSAELLQEKAFWLYYQGEDDYEIDKSIVEKYGDEDQYGERHVQFVLPCPSHVAITIDVSLTSRSIDAGFINSDKKRFELGWWDDARSHPFFLRWEEFDALCRYWETQRPLDPTTELIAKLLLSRFTGNPVNDQKAIGLRRQQIARTYDSLKLFSPKEVRYLAEHTVVMVMEDDYAWTVDKELGWVFGGEYPCYSLRNAEHADGKEGTFPFASFNELMQSLNK